MKTDLQKQKTDNLSNSNIMEKLVDEGVKFHGHLGPFLVLGLKAGLFANDILGKDCFEMHVTVETETSPPFSCVVDGIQITTGCTMGKRNIMLKKGNGLSVTFTRGEKRLRIRLKDEVLEDLRNLKSREKSERKALSLINQSIHELFDLEGQPLSRIRKIKAVQ